MGEVYTYNATHLTLIREDTVEFTQSAELGQVGSGRFTLDDTAGTLAIVGQKDFSATQSSCSVPLLFRGYIAERSYSRGEYGPKVSAARAIDVTLHDLNAMLGFRRLRQKAGLTAAEAGNRPAETVAARKTWLMASPFVVGLFVDGGRITSVTTKGMDKADYRNQFPGDVLADMALAADGFNYYVADFGSGPELVFRDDNASTADTSTLRISNVLADASGVTLHPFMDFTLRRSPDQVISDLGYSYSLGTVNEERAATATTFNGERGGVASNSNIKTAAKARDEAQDILFQRSTEEDVLEGTVLVTAAQVNLIRQGERIQAKFSHLNTEGYGSFTYFRVLERTVKPINAEGADYELKLKLSPQEAAEVVAAASIVQQAFDENPGIMHLANPPTIGNVLLVALSCRCRTGGTTGLNPPNTDIAQDRWGAGAWTAISTADSGDTWVPRSGTTEHHSVQFYWKTVDSTNQDCANDAITANFGVWEIAGADMAAATLVRANNQAANTTFDLGTLGTIAVGELAFMVTHSVPDEPLALPAVTPAAGWTQDWYRGNYDYWAATTYPVVWMGHAIGAGAVVDPSLYRGAARAFCGLAIKVPAL